jgi:3-hydroxy-3-methylglutaryl CoA synthase
MPDFILRLSREEPEDNDRWTVFAYNRRVQKSWEKMMNRIPESLERCLEDLYTQPM